MTARHPNQYTVPLPVDPAAAKSLFLKEFSENRQCGKDPPMTSSEACDVMRGENLIPCRILLVLPLRNENSTVKNTRASDGPRPECDAAHDCCNS
jgi:hypothetical protein